MSSREAFGRILERVCGEQGWEVLPGGVRVSCKGGRYQLVSFEPFESGDEELVRLSTTIGTSYGLNPVRLKTALRINHDLAHGAFAIRDDELVMIDTLPLADVDGNQVQAAISYLAETADRYERTLFGTDEH